MKKTIASLPVSRKAYIDFIERITRVIKSAPDRLAMVLALDKYLSGDRLNYDKGLTPACAMVFEMLRFDIDRAISRSAKARMRRRGRTQSAQEAPATQAVKKESGQGAASVAEPTSSATAACGQVQPRIAPAAVKESGAGEPKAAPAPVLSRRQRRMRERDLRPRMRWQKL